MHNDELTKEENDYYTKKQYETESWLIDFAKFAIGISGASLSLTLAVALNNPTSTLLKETVLLKWAWGLLGLSAFSGCILVGVVIASTYVYLERFRTHKKTEKTPKYPEWNEPLRNIAAAGSVISLASGLLLLGFALLNAITT